jgi:hypothetical protein
MLGVSLPVEIHDLVEGSSHQEAWLLVATMPQQGPIRHQTFFWLGYTFTLLPWRYVLIIKKLT